MLPMKIIHRNDYMFSHQGEDTRYYYFYELSWTKRINWIHCTRVWHREQDLNSHGIIIQEMLTGKRPTDVLFKNGLSLQKFVGNAFPQKIHEIPDPNIIIPSFEDEGVDHGNHAMVGRLSCIMQLGLSCSTETPKDRPTIKREYSALRIKGWDSFALFVRILK